MSESRMLHIKTDFWLQSSADIWSHNITKQWEQKRQHSPFIQVVFLMATTPGSVIVAIGRTRSTIVRKLVIQTPKGKERRKKDGVGVVWGRIFSSKKQSWQH